MSALASRHEFHVAVSLFDYADHSERLRHSGEGLFDYRAALVRHQHNGTVGRPALPLEHKGVAALSAGHNDLARRIDGGEFLRQHLTESGEILSVAVRNRGDFNQLCETFRIDLSFVSHKNLRTTARI